MPVKKTPARKKPARKAAPRKVYEPKVYTPVVRPTRVAAEGEEYSFTVIGRPVPKGRPRMTRRGRVFTPEKTLQAESDIRGLYDGPFFEGNISVQVAINTDAVVVTISNSVGETSKLRGDLDNYVKTVLDALNGVAWEDDRQVHVIHAEKS